MRQKSGPPKETSDQVVKDIRRATRKCYSAEEKIRIVLETSAAPAQRRRVHRGVPQIRSRPPARSL